MTSTEKKPVIPQKKATPMSAEQLIGSKISLLTNADVRYEGTLTEIDRIGRSMSLQNVRSFGTEGRRNGVQEIAALDNEIGSVVFKLDHMKDFNIIQKPNEVMQQDPAIISAAAVAKADPAKSSPSKGKDSDNLSSAARQPRNNTGGQNSAQRPNNTFKNQSRGGPKQKSGTMKENPDEELQDQLKEMFNFEQRTIQKDTVDEENKQQPSQSADDDSNQAKKPVTSDGFFDSISSSTLETEQDRQANRENAAKERDINRRKDADTFGSSMSNNFQYQDSGRNRGGNKRGGNNARGGRGRGGHNQNNNYRTRGEGGYNNQRGGHQHNQNNNYREGGYQRDNYYQGGGQQRDNNYRGGGYPRDNHYQDHNNNYYRNNKANDNHNRGDPFDYSYMKDSAPQRGGRGRGGMNYGGGQSRGGYSQPSNNYRNNNNYNKPSYHQDDGQNFFFTENQHAFTQSNYENQKY